MNSHSHSFCQQLLKSVRLDLQSQHIYTNGYTVTKSSLEGYEVQGPNRFYYYASSACCKWCAKAEALETLLRND